MCARTTFTPILGLAYLCLDATNSLSDVCDQNPSTSPFIPSISNPLLLYHVRTIYSLLRTPSMSSYQRMNVSPITLRAWSHRFVASIFVDTCSSAFPNSSLSSGPSQEVYLPSPTDLGSSVSMMMIEGRDSVHSFPRSPPESK